MAAKRQLIVFRVGAEEFAVDILLTREIVCMREITPVPETQDYVVGVMNLRGNLVPVLDFRMRLRARPEGDRAERRIIISTFEGRLTGLIVDGASEVIKVGEEMIEPAPDIVAELGVGYVAGVINLGGRFITLIDLGRALTEEILCELDEVMRLVANRQGAASSVEVGSVEVVRG